MEEKKGIFFFPQAVDMALKKQYLEPLSVIFKQIIREMAISLIENIHTQEQKVFWIIQRKSETYYPLRKGLESQSNS